MTDPLPSSASTTTPRRTTGAWIMAAVLFVLTLALHTRHNEFPYTYHPDENSKVVQILEGSRNFHHPLLLLQTTEYVSRLAFVPRKSQAIVETGRWVSGGFSAGAVVALALVAWWQFGLLVGWGAGLAVAVEDDLFELSHYFKEDPALFFGMALALLAAHIWWRQPGRASLRFLGIACALAAAGKYVGIITLGFALPMVIWHRASEAILPRAARLKIFALTFVLTFLLCNFPLFGWQVSNPFRSIKNEVHGVAGGHHGLTRKVPHAEYLLALKNKVPPPITVLAIAYAVALLATARRRTPPEWVTLLLPLAYLAMISSSPKTAERYLLPVSAMLPLLAALGAGEIGKICDSPDSRVRKVCSPIFACALLTLLIRSELPTFTQFVEVLRGRGTKLENATLLCRSYIGFQHDDPVAVADWVKENLPADAVIAEDHRVNLSITKAGDLSTETRVPQQVFDDDFAPKLGTLEELRAKGVTHVAICRQTYSRFLSQKAAPQSEAAIDFEEARKFYTRLMQEGKMVKEWPKGPIGYLQPGIKLYQMAPAEKRPAASPPP